MWKWRTAMYSGESGEIGKIRIDCSQLFLADWPKYLNMFLYAYENKKAQQEKISGKYV